MRGVRLVRGATIGVLGLVVILPSCVIGKEDDDTGQATLGLSGSGSGEGEGTAPPDGGVVSGDAGNGGCSTTSNTYSLDGYTVNVTGTSCANYTANVYAAGGGRVFSYTGPANGSGTNSWALTDPGISNYDGTLPQLGTAYTPILYGYEAVKVFEGVVAATEGLSDYDNQGCDSPADGLTCTGAGHCCDTHDQCYAANSCHSSSWFWPFAGSFACARCNAAVVGCAAGSLVSGGGAPSSCCALGTCGTPWPPGGGCCNTANCQCMVGNVIKQGSACPPCPDAGSDSGADTGSDSGAGEGEGEGEGTP